MDSYHLKPPTRFFHRIQQVELKKSELIYQQSDVSTAILPAKTESHDPLTEVSQTASVCQTICHAHGLDVGQFL